MGTLAIIQALLFHIQGESNPIYNAERGYASEWNTPQWRYYLFFLLLLAIPVLIFLGARYGIRLSVYRDQAMLFGLSVVGLLLSLAWLIPLTVLAGQGLSRERAMQTLPTLLVTPYPTEVVFMAKAAATIRNVWGRALGAAFFASILGLFFAGPVILTTSISNGLSLFAGVLLMGVGMIGVVVEHEQEVALAVVVGLAVAFASDSQRMSTFLGIVGGLLIRLMQTMLTFTLILVLNRVIPLNVTAMNMVAGTVTMLAAVPGLLTLILVLALAAVREAIIRGLFAWTVHRALES